MQAIIWGYDRTNNMTLKDFYRQMVKEGDAIVYDLVQTRAYCLECLRLYGTLDGMSVDLPKSIPRWGCETSYWPYICNIVLRDVGRLNRRHISA